MTGDGQRSPESRQKQPRALTSSRAHLEGSAHPLGQPRAATSFPPSPGHGAGAAGAAAFGEVPAPRRTWTPAVPWEGGRAPCGPRQLQTLNPGAGGSFPNLLGLYEAPAALEGEDAPGDVTLVEIRGPVQVTGEAGGELGPWHQGGFTLLPISSGHTGSVAEWGNFLKKSLGSQFAGSQGNWVWGKPLRSGCPARPPLP